MANLSYSLQKGTKLRSGEFTYEIVKVLGSGSFGITYLAVTEVAIGNITTKVKFAIKEHFMSASCYRDDDGKSVLTVPTAKDNVYASLSDFITEAKRLKKLCNNSRGIVHVNETFEANNTAYYVMEYLDGGSLQRCCEEDAISIVLQIAEALKVVHDDHVLHLDVKPDNIVLKNNGFGKTYPVLIDFGISKHFDSNNKPTSSLRAKGASSGYAPQEQYGGVNEFSPKYDIYALGAVLFFLCTGKNPPDAFKISPSQQLLRCELEGIVSPKVKNAILRAMTPNALDRTSTIDKFCEDLVGSDFSPILQPSTLDIRFEKNKDIAYVDVRANMHWIPCSDKKWCDASKKGNRIKISVSKNNKVDKRCCKITIVGEPYIIGQPIKPYKIAQTINVIQDGLGTELIVPDPKSSHFNYKILGFLFCFVFIVALSVLLINGAGKSTHKIQIAEIGNSDTIVQNSSITSKPPSYLSENVSQYVVADQKHSSLDQVEDIKPQEVDMESKKQTDEALKVSNPKEFTEALPTDDEMFARATSIEDYKALADKSYAKAYAPLAEQYLRRNDYNNAHRWAVRAANARVGIGQARKVVKILKDLGYYDDPNIVPPFL